MNPAGSVITVAPGGSLNGRFQVPGDKSISHRALMLAAIAEGRSRIRGYLESEDTLVTMEALRLMGAGFERHGSTVAVEGVGAAGLKAPPQALYLGNSGTSMRLLMGLLAGAGFSVEMRGDDSLSRRPMARVVAPLEQMGACIVCTGQGTPPLRIEARHGLRGIRYEMPVASAQLKSAILLAGLDAGGSTCVVEPLPTRNHTELMLPSFGCAVDSAGDAVCVHGPTRLKAADIDVPGDFSSAAFFIVGALISEGSEILIENVGVNPTRTAALDLLRRMGARIALERPRHAGGEPVADIRAAYSELRGVDVPPELVPNAIDEFPILLIAAACARGTTRISGASELRVKESDRIGGMAAALGSFGLEVQEFADGISVRGGPIPGGDVDSRGDHRLAMALAMAGLRSAGALRIAHCDGIATSFPGFCALAAQRGLRLSQG